MIETITLNEQKNKREKTENRSMLRWNVHTPAIRQNIHTLPAKIFRPALWKGRSKSTNVMMMENPSKTEENLVENLSTHSQKHVIQSFVSFAH